MTDFLREERYRSDILKPREDYLSPEQMDEAIDLLQSTYKLQGVEALTRDGAVSLINGFINNTPDGDIHSVLEFLNIRHKAAALQNDRIDNMLSGVFPPEEGNTNDIYEKPRRQIKEAILSAIHIIGHEDKKAALRKIEGLFKSYRKRLNKLFKNLGLYKETETSEGSRTLLTILAFAGGYSKADENISGIEAYYDAASEHFRNMALNEPLKMDDFDFTEETARAVLAKESMPFIQSSTAKMAKVKTMQEKLVPLIALVGQADNKILAMRSALQAAEGERDDYVGTIPALQAIAEEHEEALTENIELLEIYIEEFQDRPQNLREAFFDSTELHTYRREELTIATHYPVLEESGVVNFDEIAQRKASMISAETVRVVLNAIEDHAGDEDALIVETVGELRDRVALIEEMRDEIAALYASNMALEHEHGRHEVFVKSLENAIQDSVQRAGYHDNVKPILDGLAG